MTFYVTSIGLFVLFLAIVVLGDRLELRSFKKDFLRMHHCTREVVLEIEEDVVVQSDEIKHLKNIDAQLVRIINDHASKLDNLIDQYAKLHKEQS